jgi:hypothetical protein
MKPKNIVDDHKPNYSDECHTQRGHKANPTVANSKAKMETKSNLLLVVTTPKFYFSFQVCALMECELKYFSWQLLNQYSIT